MMGTIKSREVYLLPARLLKYNIKSRTYKDLNQGEFKVACCVLHPINAT